MTDIENLLVEWKAATSAPAWGIQRVFHDVFVLAAAGETTLIYGADYRDNNPCLVNTVGAMLVVGGGEGIPTRHFGEIVRLFDQINRELYFMNVNIKSGYVDPLAAQILLTHFGELKQQPEPDQIDPLNDKYIERSDDEMARSMMELFTLPECDINANVSTFDKDETGNIYRVSVQRNADNHNG